MVEQSVSAPQVPSPPREAAERAKVSAAPPDVSPQAQGKEAEVTESSDAMGVWCPWWPKFPTLSPLGPWSQ